ncbi:hypothetical protein [Caballeronia cordobensis]|uniref:hypothetical protein n=1 Tax=Caballeronia cordobensis TaxID=1353886 RepID=UPI00045EFEF5|nr:hypothetical protein BRPE67_CCDS11180 [Burkholderia sp. RPE67]
MTVRLETIRHHLANDNARMREALQLIVEMCDGQPGNEVSRYVSRIARNALVSAAPRKQGPA